MQRAGRKIHHPGVSELISAYKVDAATEQESEFRDATRAHGAREKSERGKSRAIPLTLVGLGMRSLRVGWRDKGGTRGRSPLIRKGPFAIPHAEWRTAKRITPKSTLPALSFSGIFFSPT